MVTAGMSKNLQSKLGFSVRQCGLIMANKKISETLHQSDINVVKQTCVCVVGVVGVELRV